MSSDKNDKTHFEMKLLIHSGLLIIYVLLSHPFVFSQNQVTLPSDNNATQYTVDLVSCNSTSVESSPTFYLNGLVFASNRPAPIWSGLKSKQSDFNIYYAQQRTHKFFKREAKLRGAINSFHDEGAVTFTNNQQQIYFSRSQQAFKGRTVGIFSAELGDDKVWKKVVPFQYNSAKYNYTHPRLSPDNQKLYFVSDMSNGYGGTDIYVCYWEENHWGAPINLGGEINTPGNEKYPFIHEDGSLYFASDGHLNGLGGLDIWCSKPLRGDAWETPAHLAHPLNSSADDFGLIFKADKTVGYFVSDRKRGVGKADLYVCQRVLKKEELDIDKKFLLNAMIQMKPIQFSVNQSKLSQIVTQELDKLARYLKNNSGIIVEIGVHTDARGATDHNLRLSEQRAIAINRYLLHTKKIPQQQIQYKGYGETKILNECAHNSSCTEQEHQVNNRVEVRVMKTEVTLLLEKARKVDKKINKNGELLVGKGHQLHYQIEVGPFNQINNRVFHECHNVNDNINIESTPIGQLMILGPYENERVADRHHNQIQQLGIQKARIQTTAHQDLIASRISLDDLEQKKYEVHLGPYKRFTNDLYMELIKTGTDYIHTLHTNKGLILKLGSFSNRKAASSLAKKVRRKGKRSKVMSIN